MTDMARVADLTDDELAACIADPGAFIARGDDCRQPIVRWGVSAIRARLASMPLPERPAPRAEQIEAAAIALHAWHAGPGDGKWAAATDATRGTFRDQAKAALSAVPSAER